MDTLEVLRAASIKRHEEWSNGANISLAYRGLELGGEVGEAQNVIKKLEREKLGMVGSRATKEELADELADVVICADLIAMDQGIDLGAAVIKKFNKTSEKNGLKTSIFSGRAGKKPKVIVDNGILRRNRLDLLTSLEMQIYAAFQSVENSKAHPLLTQAGMKIQEAMELVADYVERDS